MEEPSQPKIPERKPRTREEILSFKNYYAILGIDKNASLSDIRSAYIDLAIIFKSDEKTFKKIEEAYATLSDGKKRANYDNNVAHFPESFMTDGRLDRLNNKIDSILSKRKSSVISMLDSLDSLFAPIIKEYSIKRSFLVSIVEPKIIEKFKFTIVNDFTDFSVADAINKLDKNLKRFSIFMGRGLPDVVASLSASIIDSFYNSILRLKWAYVGRPDYMALFNRDLQELKEKLIALGINSKSIDSVIVKVIWNSEPEDIV